MLKILIKSPVSQKNGFCMENKPKLGCFGKLWIFKE